MNLISVTNPRHAQHAARGLQACLVGVLLGLAVASGASAQKPPNTTAGEIALLPKYCPDTMGFSYGDAYTNTSPRAGYWVGLMGKSFWAMHHHCWGLQKIRRAYAPGTTGQAREAYLLSAINEFNYVLNNSTADFIMLPEVYLRLGETYAALRNIGAANEAFDMALRHKPDFPPPYLRRAETLEKVGNKKGALAVLEEGLRRAPASTELQTQYKRLGGNLEALLKTVPPALAVASAPADPAASAPAAAQPAAAAASQ